MPGSVRNISCTLKSLRAFAFIKLRQQTDINLAKRCQQHAENEARKLGAIKAPYHTFDHNRGRQRGARCTPDETV